MNTVIPYEDPAYAAARGLARRRPRHACSGWRTASACTRLCRDSRSSGTRSSWRSSREWDSPTPTTATSSPWISGRAEFRHHRSARVGSAAGLPLDPLGQPAACSRHRPRRLRWPSPEPRFKGVTIPRREVDPSGGTPTEKALYATPRRHDHLNEALLLRESAQSNGDLLQVLNPTLGPILDRERLSQPASPRPPDPRIDLRQ